MQRIQQVYSVYDDMVLTVVVQPVDDGLEAVGLQDLSLYLGLSTHWGGGGLQFCAIPNQVSIMQL